eukprot:g20445.t1
MAAELHAKHGDRIKPSSGEPSSMNSTASAAALVCAWPNANTKASSTSVDQLQHQQHKKKTGKAVFQEFHEEAELLQNRRKSSVDGVLPGGGGVGGGIAIGGQRRGSVGPAQTEETELPILKRRGSIEQIMAEMDAKEKKREEEFNLKKENKRRKSMAAKETSPAAKDVSNTLQFLKEALVTSKESVNAAYMGWDP